jgi:hypothetical protein
MRFAAIIPRAGKDKWGEMIGALQAAQRFRERGQGIGCARILMSRREARALQHAVLRSAIGLTRLNEHTYHPARKPPIGP